MGGRLLRTNLLAPHISEFFLNYLQNLARSCYKISVQNEIDRRLDAVEEVVQSEEMYNAVKVSLRALNKIDIDKLISSVKSPFLH